MDQRQESHHQEIEKKGQVDPSIYSIQLPFYSYTKILLPYLLSKQNNLGNFPEAFV